MSEKDRLNQTVKDLLNKFNEGVDVEEEDVVADKDVFPDVSSLLKAKTVSHENLVGTKLGHWTIQSKIGQGGMSTIYMAERNDDQLNQKVALKVLTYDLVSETLIKRFIRERQILADLNHQNIAKLFDVGITESGTPWFVMEWVQGSDILAYARTHKLNVEQKVTLFKQVCGAMSYAHAKGVIHRDLKPANILVTENNEVKLLDFGIAAIDEEQSLTMTGAVMGTPGYMSPEQAKGNNQSIDRRSDVFSAGVLLYKLIKGEMPFQAGSISEISYKIIHEEPTLIGHHVSSDIQAIVFKCLEKSIDDRYESFKQLNRDLDAYLSGDVISAQKVTSLGRLSKKAKKHKLVTSVLVIALLATILGVTYGVMQSIASAEKVALTKKFLAKTADIKNKIRRTHMLPFHDVQHSYKGIISEIKALSAGIVASGFDDEGLSDFAIGTAYFDMRKDEAAMKYLLESEQAGYESNDLYSSLGMLYANQWQAKKSVANAIDNEQQRTEFLNQAKQQYYIPATNYLTKTQIYDGAQAEFLNAYVAFIESRYEDAIIFIEKEIENNPWHYEAMVLAADAYSELAIMKGSEEGQDSNVELLELSNEMLAQALAIGSSDPKNHSKKCTYMGRDINYQKFFNYQEVEQIYQDGLSHCNAALSLNPTGIPPFEGLFQLHKIRAEYQEYLDRKSLNEYNSSVSDEALEYYKKSLEVVTKGLILQPNNFNLLLHQIKPLYVIAYHTYLNGGDPMPSYEKALAATEKAQKLNVSSSKPILQKAYVYSEMAHYFMTILKDLEQAEDYAVNAVDAAIQAKELNPVYTSVIRVNAYRYSLANVKYEQGETKQAADILRQSIRERFDVIPRRAAFFKNFNDIMRAQNVLLDLFSDVNDSLQDDIEYGAEMINLVCAFEELLDEQKGQLQKLIKPYLENDRVKSNDFEVCLNILNTQ